QPAGRQSSPGSSLPGLVFLAFVRKWGWAAAVRPPQWATTTVIARVDAARGTLRLCYNRRAFGVPEDCIDKRFIRTNERIRTREVRVIGDEGEQIGIMPPFEALKMAREKNLDLVEISPTAQPPVCRIMDYGKFLYQQEKKEREAKKHQKT